MKTFVCLYDFFRKERSWEICNGSQFRQGLGNKAHKAISKKIDYLDFINGISRKKNSLWKNYDFGF